MLSIHFKYSQTERSVGQVYRGGKCSHLMGSDYQICFCWGHCGQITLTVSNNRLHVQVVPLSPRPSSVVINEPPGKRPQETLEVRSAWFLSSGFCATNFFLGVFFFIMHNQLSKRGITHNLCDKGMTKECL